MKKVLLLGTLALLSGLSLASGQTCSARVTGTAKLADAHHVAYTVTVANPTATPLRINLRVDFFARGVKLPGGFENLIGTVPAKGKKVFTGRETFAQTLKVADGVRVTRIRLCK